MVAEPVQATLSTLNYYFNQASDIIHTQHEKLNNTDFVGTLNQYNPFSSQSAKHIGSQHPRVSSGYARLWYTVTDNIWRNKRTYASVLTIGLGASTYLYLHSSRRNTVKEAARPKRRAPKLANGARRDVVLVIGSPTVPLTRLIALDLEKRGLIVYLTILDEKDFKFIESNPITDDINYLNLYHTQNFESQLAKFHHFLELPVVPFQGASHHNLRLVSVIFTPSLYFPIGPIENIAINTWIKLNDRFLIYLKLFSSGLIDLIRNQGSNTILINPNIISSLKTPYHAPEVLYHNNMSNLFTLLAREIAPQGMSITQVKLGNLHISTQSGSSESKISNIVNSEVRSWDSKIKDLYGKHFSNSQFKSNPIKSGGRGTSLRELYHILFDLSYGKSNPGVVYCGVGARSYDLISKILPQSWIACFLR